MLTGAGGAEPPDAVVAVRPWNDPVVTPEVRQDPQAKGNRRDDQAVRDRSLTPCTLERLRHAGREHADRGQRHDDDVRDCELAATM